MHHYVAHPLKGGGEVTNLSTETILKKAERERKKGAARNIN